MRFYLLTSLLVFCVANLFLPACIPSSTEPQKKAKETSPTVANDNQSTPNVETSHVQSGPEGEHLSASDPGVSNLHVPLDPAAMPSTAIEMPVISLIRLEDKPGYMLNAKFPVDGLAMEGTLMRQAPGRWLLSGQFKTSIEAFTPSEPTIQHMDLLKPGEGGTMALENDQREIIISFAAPMPPKDSPLLPEPKTIPFSKSFEAPDNAMFFVLLTPF